MSEYYKQRGLPTREMMPLNGSKMKRQREAYREYVRKYGHPQEEPLPEGASLRDFRVMRLVFDSMIEGRAVA